MGEIISKLLALYDSNLEFAGFITFFSLAILLYIFFQFVLAWFNHRAARREYQYERSRSTGEARFEKEAFHLEKLSESLAQLVSFSISIPDCSIFSKSKWRKLYENSVASLGAAAPFIDYYNNTKGVEWCGVAERARTECSAEGKHANTTQSSNGLPETNASLFSRAIKILDSSSLITRKTFGDDFLVTVFGAVNISDEIDAEHLIKQYRQFVSCSYCRIKNSEEGREDARRHRIEERAKHALSSIGLISWINQRYEAACPHDRGESYNKSSIFDVIAYLSGRLYALLKWLVLLAFFIALAILVMGVILFIAAKLCDLLFPSTSMIDWLDILQRKYPAQPESVLLVFRSM